MNPIQIARMLWARRAIVLFMTLGGLLLGVLIANWLPARYEATSRLMFDLLTPDPVSGNAIGMRDGGTYLKTQAEIITDYRTAGRVVDAFGWTASPELAARYAARPADDRRDFRRWLAQMVMDSTTVNVVGGSNIIEITYGSNSAESARTMADAVRQAYIDQAIASKRESATSNARWFERETARLKKELADAEQRKADFEKKNGIILNDQDQDTETARLQALAQSIPVAQGGVVAGPVNVPSQAQVAQLEVQIAAAAADLGPNHPQLIALRQQKALAEQAVQRELAVARSGGPAGPNMQSALSAQTQKVLEKRGLVGEAQRLAANVAVLRAQYQKTATRMADVQQQAQSPDSGLTLLGNAVAPNKPTSPNVPLLIFVGLVGGLAIGVGIALAIELLQRRVRGIEDLTFEGIPVIGTMDHDPESVSRDFWYWIGLPRAPWKKATS